MALMRSASRFKVDRVYGGTTAGFRDRLVIFSIWRLDRSIAIGEHTGETTVGAFGSRCSRLAVSRVALLS